MIRSRSKKVLLVAPDSFPSRLLDQYENVNHISSITAIFPCIHEFKPDVILFDHAHMNEHMERVLRRLRSNMFYKNIRICCYKHTESVRNDATLKVLGVHHMIYHDDLQKVSKSKHALNAINNIIDTSLLKWLAGAGN
ncbi:hypothetical protein [Mucilaginibacter sp.]|uniref:hypothetical protein n=1 Tax=Mucilaginibacter sp. TaxID=1882438 RepID=UPI000CB0D117|nr:hypothetical protein [Mucilaginibacter sp.]PLW89961.1 MAG: hypothetical protein C0154_08865 [Mucilaginibacter sp.]HEK19377.1 hypothetical protein [Bacteroidota bacterium]